jgi:hypothetical protein
MYEGINIVLTQVIVNSFTVMPCLWLCYDLYYFQFILFFHTLFYNQVEITNLYSMTVSD